MRIMLSSDRESFPRETVGLSFPPSFFCPVAMVAYLAPGFNICHDGSSNMLEQLSPVSICS